MKKAMCFVDFLIYFFEYLDSNTFGNSTAMSGVFSRKLVFSAKTIFVQYPRRSSTDRFVDCRFLKWNRNSV